MVTVASYPSKKIFSGADDVITRIWKWVLFSRAGDGIARL
jgi:hypothetical protein